MLPYLIYHNKQTNKKDQLHYNTQVRYFNVRDVIMRKAVHLNICQWDMVTTTIY